MKKANSINYWVENLLYPKFVIDTPHLIRFLPAVKFILNKPFRKILSYCKLDYKLFSVNFDYRNDTLSRISLKHCRGITSNEEEKIHFLCCKGWQKTLIFCFSQGHLHPFCVWRLPETSKEEKRLVNECHMIEKLSSLDPRISKAIPHIIYEGFINNRHAFLYSVKEGNLLEKQILAYSNSLCKIDEIVRLLRDWLIILHDKSRCMVSGGEAQLTLRDIVLNSLRIYRKHVDLSKDEFQRTLDFIGCEIDNIKDLPFLFVVQHRDFQPENILYDEINREIGVLDWEYSLEKGLPLIDLLSFLCITLSRVMADKIINSKRSFRFIPRFTSLVYGVDEKQFHYLFYDTNEISRLLKKHVDIYCNNLKIDKRLLKLLFFIFIIQDLSHKKVFLKIFLDRQDSLLWKN